MNIYSGQRKCLSYTCPISDYDLQTIYHLSVFQEEHMNQLMYQLPLKDTWLPRVFHVMEREKGESNGDLEDYSVSQLTLDDVSFTNKNM